MKKKLREILNGKKLKNIEELNEKCLGCIIRKPIKNDEDYYLIGRTYLRPYPSEVSNNIHRKFITIQNKCNLCGIDLQIDSLPFHQQDVAVGACASAALWMVQFSIRDWYNIPIRSLAEITEKSQFYYKYPIYPSEGLTIDEMCKYISIIGLHFHVIEIGELYKELCKIHDKEKVDKYMNWFIENVIKAYFSDFSESFPIICGLSLFKYPKKPNKREKIEGLHGVVISGYREEKGKITELYLHDDQIGPYCRTRFLGSKILLENEWKKKWDEIRINTFLVPVDPLIKLTFSRISQQYMKKIRDIAKENGYEDFKIFLSSVNNYKKKLLLNHNIKKYTLFEYEENKTKQHKVPKHIFLQKNFPKYLWIIRFLKGNNEIRDIILDATRTVWHKIAEIEF